MGVYDALVSKRVYKSAYGIEEAESMILNGQCGVFSPGILACFPEAKQELISLTQGEFAASAG